MPSSFPDVPPNPDITPGFAFRYVTNFRSCLVVSGLRWCSMPSASWLAASCLIPSIPKNSMSVSCFCLMPSAMRAPLGVRFMPRYFSCSMCPSSSSLLSICVTLGALTSMYLETSSVVAYPLSSTSSAMTSR